MSAVVSREVVIIVAILARRVGMVNLYRALEPSAGSDEH